MAAKIMGYWDFTEIRDRPLVCPDCGWAALPDKWIQEDSDGLFDVRCTQCRKMHLIVMFPTVEETRQAAAAGNALAAAELDSIGARAQKAAEFHRRASESLLPNGNGLPDLSDEHIVIDWDLEIVDDERWTILRHGDTILWREIAYWEGIDRFAEVAEILRSRYGNRLVELRPTDSSEMYLLGDRLQAPDQVDEINSALREGRWLPRIQP